ncbi:hypothetical protein PPYR_10970 [Photinus pyralis]|uniref:hydroxyisourate hydrolase n=1 Tax=Photinus pyralis TaxID=7054 RepID=A0A1Y1K810_PHOPY|nr:uncharacterized protein LOC116174386 [Photinus pyralis]KAB0796909.1 hypothetical protein PPYR_10970 [Photinus pyralis]
MENQEDEESHQSSHGIDVIQVHFSPTYQTTLSTSHQQAETIGNIKGKYYKQTYRTAWENMPDFRGWLRGVQGEPTRAYCMYCQKTLHAHRLSLLKHTCTIRHQKAAQIHNIRKNKEMSQSQEIHISGANTTGEHDGLNAEEEAETIVEYAEFEDSLADDEEGEHDEDVEDEEESMPLDAMSTEVSKQFRQNIPITMASAKPPITTHVLDTSRGTPVTGLQVSLYKLIDGRWTYINEGVTNSDGRFGNFLERSDFTPGRYKLHYDVDRFFEARKQDTLYPFIEIVFDCRAPNDHYHVPLLLSPFGYTTYRGT